jgi:hypothetical protein
MRMTTLVTSAVLAAVIALPATAPAQVRISVAFGARLGPALSIYAYSPAHFGDWRRDYDRWTPVAVYDVNGNYYRYRVPGAREVVVYHYRDAYFFPPQDEAWVGSDRRYDYRHRPDNADWHRARAYAAYVPADPRLGAAIDVWDYSPDRAGDWRTNYTRWTPVIVYAYDGRYYPHEIRGARPVEVYRYRYEYFLPPPDQKWVGFDRRYDYKDRPDASDRDRAQGRNPGPAPDRGRGHDHDHGRGRGRGGGTARPA